MHKLKLPNLNYGDFYKFTTSFSLIIFLIGIWGLSQTAFEWNEKISNNSIFVGAILFFVVLIVSSIILFIWAIIKWFNNQKLLDRRLKTETNLKVGKYEKIINELAKDEKDPMEYLNKKATHSCDLTEMKRSRVRSKIERR